MIRKIKAFGLAAFAILALGAFSAATASAAEFHSEVINTTLTGTRTAEDVFSTNSGTVRCDHAHYSGVQAAQTTTTVEVTPIFTGCQAFGWINIPIDHNGCKYVFHSGAGTAGTESPGTVSINCPAGKAITVTAFNCWVTVGSQNNLPGIIYHNTGSGSGRFVELKVNINPTGGNAGIKYTQHSKSFPGCINGTFTNGRYAGGGHVKGTNSVGNPVGIWVH